MKKIRKNWIYILLIGIITCLTTGRSINAQNLAPTVNIFAERPLLHILGPSPAITPSDDESAVDSYILESCDVLKDNDGKYYWY